MYSISENIYNVRAFVIADYVLAFCGNKMYAVKTRHGDPELCPCRPDLVLAYISKPKPKVLELDTYPPEKRKKV